MKTTLAATVAIALMMLTGCATPAPNEVRDLDPAVAGASDADRRAFVDGYRALFPGAERSGQTDKQILDGSTAICSEIASRGVNGYREYIATDVPDAASKAKVRALVSLAAATVCR